jgi:hypothetical protein
MTIRRGPLRLPLPLCRGPLRLGRSGPPLQQQVLAIAGASWPVEPGSAS